MKMTRLLKIFVIFVVLLMCIGLSTGTESYGETTSAGKEFFFAFQPNYTGGNLSLFITGKENTQGVVEIPQLSFSKSFTVAANTVTTVALPSGAQSLGSNQILKLGVHVMAEKEVTVYGLNQVQYTTDAFLGLPVDVLGSEYAAMSYQGLGSYSSQVAAVGVHDNTKVTITPSSAANGRPAGVPFTITLNRFESFQLTSPSNDLSGSIFTSSAPIALMSGVNCANVPTGVGYCDHLVEMMPPVSTWGKSFLTTPLATRLKGDLVRILASQDETTIRINGELVATINRGKVFDKIVTVRTQIEASAPVLVAQYSVGQAYDNVVSDPFMMLVTPTEQFLNQYTFSTPAIVNFQKQFVNVVAPISAVSSILLDGMPINTALFSPIGDSGYSGAQIPLATGSHTITGDAGFGIYIYGFGNCDSYGYPGGGNFQSINPAGDAYPPNVRLTQVGDTIQGMATDSEDVNANGILDAGEDLNGNGTIDRRNEDINGNGKLDPGEDLNGNGLLDRDTGVFKVELDCASTNLQLNVMPFIPGTLTVNFSIALIDATAPGTGTLRISDGVGNTMERPITLYGLTTLRDVRVINTVFTKNIEIDQASFSSTPYSVTPDGDRTLIEWRFDYIPAGLTEAIAFDVIMKNPIDGEQRLVSSKLELLYRDVNGNPVRTELGPQYVHVLSSAFEGTVTTDKPSYAANEDVTITATVKSLSEYARTIDAKILIEDTQGILVREVAAVGAITLAAGETRTLSPVIFNTGATLAGSYRAHLILSDAGTQVGEAYGNFVITPPGDTASVASKVITDKMSYGSNEQVGITSTVQNIAVNAILTNLTARISIIDNAGSVLFTEMKPIAILTAGSRVDLTSYWNTSSNPPGSHRVTIEVSDGATALSTSQALFAITGLSQNGQGITGTISATPSPVYQGLPETVTYTVTNTGNEGITGTITILVVDPVTKEIKQTREIPATLASGVSYPGTLDIPTTSLTLATYLVILQVASTAMTQPKTLASAPFEVKAGVEITKTIPDSTSLLVWVNDKCSRYGKHCDGKPKECIRTDLVEAILNEAGITYHMVYSNRDFAKEMRNPLYTDFMILGDHEPLTDHYAMELREQVYSGKGLISSLYLKGGKCSDEETIFGLNYKGQLAGSSHTVTVVQSTLFDAATLTARGDALRVDADHPENIMAWIDRQKGYQCEPATEYPAIITNQYGKGRVIFFAFDVGETLDEAQYGAISPILRNAINAVHTPTETTDFSPNTMVPVTVTLKSLGGALDLRLTETYPQQVRLYDPLLPQWITDTPWITLVHLDASEAKTIPFYVLTPDISGSFELKTDIEYLENTVATPLKSLPVTIPVVHTMADMTRNTMNALTALPVTSRLDKAATGNAVMFLGKVQSRKADSLSEIEKNIADILKAVESLLKVKTADVTEIRLMLDEILKGWEGAYSMR